MSLQKRILESIKEIYPVKSLFVHDLTEILSISTDSAYRRLRGDTELTLSEIEKICNHYDLSLDRFLKKASGCYTFKESGSTTEQFNYSEYLRSLHNGLCNLGELEAYELIFSAKDFPFFYHFLFPEIAEFKGFFWEKTIFQSIKDRKRLFSVDDLDNKNVDLGNKIADMYAQISCSELWNDEIFNSILSQIRFYHESQFFASTKDTIVLLDCLNNLIDHFELQAERGHKFLIGDNSNANKGKFNLYYNDVIIGHNYVLIKHKTGKRLYMAHNVINSIYTDDDDICNSSWKLHQRLMASAHLISETSESQRIKFFNRLRKKVTDTRKQLI